MSDNTPGPRPSGSHLKDERQSQHLGWHRRGYLPHFDVSAAYQSITYRLADSLPRHAIAGIEVEVASSPDDLRSRYLRRRIEALLDSGSGSCVLRDPVVAELVVNAWRHFDGVRYRLQAWVVMPNHVHVLIEVIPGHPLPGIINGWKSFTANRINRHLGRRGRLWMLDYWDRFVRDAEHYARVVEYIHANPMKAGLVKRPEEWRWSSAHRETSQK